MGEKAAEGGGGCMDRAIRTVAREETKTSKTVRPSAPHESQILEGGGHVGSNPELWEQKGF